MTSTKEEYSKNGLYTPEREMLHNKIMEKLIVGPSEQNPVITLMLGGGSASGKSSVRKKIVSDMQILGINHITIIDADDIKEDIPDYKVIKNLDPEDAARYVHDESSDISEKLINRCIQEKRSFLYDGTMKNLSKYSQLLERLKAAGYTTNVFVIDVPIEIAIKRAEDRFIISGRKVPRDVIIESHIGVSQTFFKLREEFDQYVLYDNSGTKPEIIAKKIKGDESILDLHKVKEFRQKGLV
ncbi:putative ABC-type ATPase [Tumebacillus sp. BK434]|uniref:zeta toxin family protein n=1 Tax=Tumebacillus sp. BK434 TaxID=2512169 RepID=UPI00104349D0|nr:zeta toxin family protein [Tumebacillus sp. BK434]TCP57562.1 putative ABC-type ATPase [Tumebacillus sp. BK434]